MTDPPVEHAGVVTLTSPAVTASSTRRWWVLGSILVAVVGLGGGLASLEEPHDQDAAGFYVPLAHGIYRDPGNLVSDEAPELFHTPLHAVTIATGCERPTRVERSWMAQSRRTN